MTTVRFELPKTGVCDCGDDESYHPGGGPCDYHPDPMVSECPCIGFHESPRYEWRGPDAELARRVASAKSGPTFFSFRSAGTRNVVFDAPIEGELLEDGVRGWYRIGALPEDLAELAARARDDDLVAAVYLDALLERGLARPTGS